MDGNVLEDSVKNQDSLKNKTLLVRKTAVNHGHWKPKEEMKIKFAENYRVDERNLQNASSELDANISNSKELSSDLQNLSISSAERSDKWKILTAVTAAKTKFSAPLSLEYYDAISTEKDLELENSKIDQTKLNENPTNEKEYKWDRNAPLGFTKKLQLYKAGFSPFGSQECLHEKDCIRSEFPNVAMEEFGKVIDKASNGRNEKVDPFRYFEVEHEPPHELHVTVLCGRNISRGRVRDYIDIPDPYVFVHIRAAPDGKKFTNYRVDNANPTWRETLTFLLPPQPLIEHKPICAEITLMESNYGPDEIYGTVEFDVGILELDKKIKKTFLFNETSEVDIEFLKVQKLDQDVRSSLALCEEEKQFRKVRKRHVKEAMNKLIEENGYIGGPRNIRETPTIAVLGSGGGFRAMIGYAGAIKALNDSGILDCCMYTTGLSGSSWYLASLYADENFPKCGTEETRRKLRENIKSSPFWLLKPHSVMRYSNRMRAKLKLGLPVTFTDFFGMLIGQTLLGSEKMEKAKLSDFRDKIKIGKVPLPVMTCLHVRPKISALVFHDWVEFTPYEVGMAKYGTFMKSEYFGSKFYMGVLAKKHEESPLHFLMGVWGSAFSILFNRLDKPKIERDEESSDDFRSEMLNEVNALNGKSNDRDEESDSDDDSDAKFLDSKENISPKVENDSQSSSGMFSSFFNWSYGNSNEQNSTNVNNKPKKGSGFLMGLISSVFGREFCESREYRAGKVLNYMRGLSLSKTYPISPFTPLCLKDTIAEEDEFERIFESIEVYKKKVHVVDAGLTFNSPYPPMLRPQRAVDIIISFDFSRRDYDDSEPFKELLLAEKWARLHQLPFPKIDRTVYQREGLKECYVFKDEESERSPVIIHFTLCNLKFRDYSKPDVLRKPDDSSGEFSIFENPKNEFSTFNFQYSNEAFDQLHDLMEFNTLLHINTIVEEIMDCVRLLRRSKVRGSVTLNDIRNSVHMSLKNKKILENEVLSQDEIRFAI